MTCTGGGGSILPAVLWQTARSAPDYCKCWQLAEIELPHWQVVEQMSLLVELLDLTVLTRCQQHAGQKRG